MESPLTIALRQFEATEANLAKAERLLSEAENMVPTGIVFGSKPDYDTRCRSLKEIERHLPAINGWKLEMISATGFLAVFECSPQAWRNREKTARFPGDPPPTPTQRPGALRLNDRASNCLISRPSHRSCVRSQRACVGHMLQSQLMCVGKCP